MRATVIHGTRDIRLEDAPRPTLAGTGRDAIVRVVAACICGSDLWPYRGVAETAEPKRIGHEFVGIVEEVGDGVTGVAPGDFVIAPFYDCDMTCAHCLNGVSPSCQNSNWWGRDDRDGHFADGAQGEFVRVPTADGSLTVVPGLIDDVMVPHLLTLSDVMGTGWHAAVSAGVAPGSTVVVVGDGAVGLCGVIAAQQLGAARIIAMSRHADRQALAREFGASDIVAERGDAGIEAIMSLTDGIGADSVLECVGTAESMDQAIRAARPGGRVGYVGVPHGGAELPIRALFSRNVGVAGGIAPVRNYVDALLPLVLDGTIQPGRVFDRQLPLDEVVEGYRLMDEREAIKVLLRP